jgi:hypothetical protein
MKHCNSETMKHGYMGESLLSARDGHENDEISRRLRTSYDYRPSEPKAKCGG